VEAQLYTLAARAAGVAVEGASAAAGDLEGDELIPHLGVEDGEVVFHPVQRNAFRADFVRGRVLRLEVGVEARRSIRLVA